VDVEDEMKASATERVSVRVEEDVIVNRPIEDVFARLADVSHYSDWMSHRGIFKESRQCSDGPVGQGTPFIDKGRMGTFSGDVEEFEAPKRVVFKERLRWFGAPVVEARVRYELEPTPEGTAVHHVAESTLFGAFRVMKPMVGIIGRGERRRTVGSLKKSLEAET
jgi:uncharacterized protein YndB with AHSA1/START domain